MEKSLFQFTDPILKEIEFILNENMDPQKVEGYPLSTNTTIKRNENGPEAIVALQVEIYDKSYSDSIPFFAHVVMEAHFAWDESLKEERISSLLSQNAPAVLLSYIRPYISQFTVASGLPPFNLPFMNFTDNTEQEQ